MHGVTPMTGADWRYGHGVVRTRTKTRVRFRSIDGPWGTPLTGVKVLASPNSRWVALQGVSPTRPPPLSFPPPLPNPNPLPTVRQPQNGLSLSGMLVIAPTLPNILHAKGHESRCSSRMPCLQNSHRANALWPLAYLSKCGQSS